MIRTIAKKLHILTGMALICITGIVRSATLPEYYGVYAVDGGKLIEIKNTGGLYEFGRNVQFIFFDKTINMLSGSIEIRKSVFIRNELIRGSDGPSVPCTPFERRTCVRDAPHQWRASRASPVETRIKPISGQPEQVYAVPREPLPPGAYSISFGGKIGVGYFFVDKNSVLQNLEAGPHCVDLEFFPFDPGGHGKEVPCNRKSSTSGVTTPRPPPDHDEVVDVSSGCRLYNGRWGMMPLIAKTTWSGKCENGYAQGLGILRYYDSSGRLRAIRKNEVARGLNVRQIEGYLSKSDGSVWKIGDRGPAASSDVPDWAREILGSRK